MINGSYTFIHFNISPFWCYLKNQSGKKTYQTIYFGKTIIPLGAFLRSEHERNGDNCDDKKFLDLEKNVRLIEIGKRETVTDS